MVRPSDGGGRGDRLGWQALIMILTDEDVLARDADAPLKGVFYIGVGASR